MTTLKRFLHQLFTPPAQARKGARHVQCCVSAEVKKLEDRTMLHGGAFGVLLTDYVQAAEVAPADTVVMSEFSAFSSRRAYLDDVTFRAQAGTNFGDIESFSLLGDFRDARGRWGRSDGVFETTIQTGVQPVNDTVVTFDPGWYGYHTARRGASFQVTASIADDASSQQIGFSDSNADFDQRGWCGWYGYRGWRSRWWGGYCGVRTFEFGAQNPTHTIVSAEQPADLTIGIDGPASQTFVPTQNDAVLATVTFDSSETLVVTNLPILVDTSTPVSDVELRNVQTGQTLDAVLSHDGLTQDVWTIEQDFVITGDSTWEVRVDIDGNVNQQSDTVRASVLNFHEVGGRNWFTTAEQLDSGSNNVAISPGGILSANVHSIAAPSLTLVQSTLVSTDTVVENQKDVNLLRFETRAGEAADLLVTGTTFQVATGSSNDFENYSWWVDTDGNREVDTILEGGVSAVNGIVSFTNPIGGGFVNSAAETVVYEIHGDVARSLTKQEFQFGLTVNPIEVETLDDGSIVTNVTTIPSESTVFTLVEQGDLYVVQDSNPVRQQYLLGGTLSGPVMSLKLHAENEDIDVTYVGLNVDSAGQSIDRFELFFEGEVTPFGFVTRGGAQNGDDFGGAFQSRQFIAEEGEDRDVIVRARTKRDTAGGISGETITVSLGTVTARGDVSNNNLLMNDGDNLAEGEIFTGVDTPGPNAEIVGPEHTVVMSQIISVTNANPAADGTSIPTGFSPLGQIKYASAAHSNSNGGLNDAIINSQTFTFVGVGIEFDPSGFALYNKADSTIAVTDYILTQVNQTTWRIAFDDLADSVLDTEIDQGDDLTLVLAANITNPQTGSSPAEAQVFAELDSGLFGWLDEDGNGSTLFDGLLFLERRISSTLYQN